MSDYEWMRPDYGTPDEPLDAGLLKRSLAILAEECKAKDAHIMDMDAELTTLSVHADNLQEGQAQMMARIDELATAVAREQAIRVKLRDQLEATQDGDYDWQYHRAMKHALETLTRLEAEAEAQS